MELHTSKVAGGQNNILMVIISFSPAFIANPAKMEFPPTYVKNNLTNI
jgi:hypothetical protein